MDKSHFYMMIKKKGVIISTWRRFERNQLSFSAFGDLEWSAGETGAVYVTYNSALFFPF